MWCRQFAENETVEGALVFSQASELSRLVPDNVFDDGDCRDATNKWLVVMLTGSCLRLLSISSRVPSLSDTLDAASAVESVDDDELSISSASRQSSGDEEPACESECSQRDPKRPESAVTTLKEKYQLPDTSWGNDSDAPSHVSPGGQRPVRKGKLTADAYDQVRHLTVAWLYPSLVHTGAALPTSAHFVVGLDVYCEAYSACYRQQNASSG